MRKITVHLESPLDGVQHYSTMIEDDVDPAVNIGLAGGSWVEFEAFFAVRMIDSTGGEKKTMKYRRIWVPQSMIRGLTEEIKPKT